MKNINNIDNKDRMKDIKAFKFALDKFIGQMEDEWEKIGVYSEKDALLMAKSSVASSKILREAMFGCMRGQFTMAEDFDESLEDFLEYME